MATKWPPNPWLVTVSLADTSAHSLLDLLGVIAAAASPALIVPTACSGLKIELDIEEAGTLYIGNFDVATDNWADKLVASQYHQEPVHDANSIPLQDIYLLGSEADDFPTVAVASTTSTP